MVFAEESLVVFAVVFGFIDVAHGALANGFMQPSRFNFDLRDYLVDQGDSVAVVDVVFMAKDTIVLVIRILLHINRVVTFRTLGQRILLLMTVRSPNHHLE